VDKYTVEVAQKNQNEYAVWFKETYGMDYDNYLTEQASRVGSSQQISSFGEGDGDEPIQSQVTDQTTTGGVESEPESQGEPEHLSRHTPGTTTLAKLIEQNQNAESSNEPDLDKTKADSKTPQSPTKLVQPTADNSKKRRGVSPSRQPPPKKTKTDKKT
jgi:hypothetical protein